MGYFLLGNSNRHGFRLYFLGRQFVFLIADISGKATYAQNNAYIEAANDIMPI